MNRQEFIEILGGKLGEELPQADVLSQTQYYQGYIDGEMRKGKTEEEVLEELGDPLLIARNILESPRNAGAFGNPYPDQEESYFEGAYEGENHPAAEEVKAQMKEASEAAARKYREAQERAAVHEAERAEGIRRPGDASPGDASSGHASPESAAAASGEESGRGGIMKDVNGDFNWGLFALILAGVMILVAIGWIVGKVFSLIGPGALIVIAVILIVRTLSRRD